MFFIIITLVIILSIPSLIIYFFHRWLSKKGYKWIGNLLSLSFIAFLFYFTFRAFYPADSFYFDVFKKITKRDIPKSALIINKTFYPDFLSQDISCSLIKLTKKDYTKLLDEFINDQNLLKNTEKVDYEMSYDGFGEIMRHKNVHDIKFSFTKKINGVSDHRSFIGFFKDQETIIVWFYEI